MTGMIPVAKTFCISNIIHTMGTAHDNIRVMTMESHCWISTVEIMLTGNDLLTQEFSNFVIPRHPIIILAFSDTPLLQPVI
jgi:hypothetical protein